MARLQFCTHSATFKTQVAVAAQRGDTTLGEIAEKFKIHPNRVTSYTVKLLKRRSEAFDENADGTPAPYIEEMEATIGRLSLKNVFLESALVKAGLLSAKS